MGWPEILDTCNRIVRSPGVFGETVTYRPRVGSPVTITAAFSEEYEEVASDSNLTVVSARPNVLLRLADLALEPVEGDRLDCRGQAWAVEESRTDGTGTSRVFLRKVAP